MYIQQSDLLRGLGKEFVKAVMDLAHKEDHKRGFLLFREGDRANHFFILLKGRVNITLGGIGHSVYTVDHPGEAFGLSSLIGREHYIASAECKEPTKLLRFSAKEFEKAIEADPVNSLAFFRRLAGVLGGRLFQTFKMISGATQPESSVSFGTGQVMESETTVS
jgi:CRP/FNR family cyclic AMP-dependent transcriptional regulator